jgi:hypothetical protein
LYFGFNQRNQTGLRLGFHGILHQKIAPSYCYQMEIQRQNDDSRNPYDPRGALIFFDYYSNDAVRLNRIQAFLSAAGDQSLRFDFL